MKIKTFQVENRDGSLVDWVSIDDGVTLTSMTKEYYDAQQAATLASELSNPSTPQAGE